MTKAAKIRWLQRQIQHQQKWIEQCESNGVSYAGENGPAIRHADYTALREWQAQLRILKS